MPLKDFIPKWIRAEAQGEKHAPLNFNAPVDIQAGEEKDGKTTAPRFQMLAYTGVPMSVDGWYHPVVVDLAGMKVAPRGVKALRDHDRMKVIGHADDVRVTATEVNIGGVISGSNRDTKEIIDAASNGFPWEASIGAKAERVERLEAGKKATVNRREVTGPASIIRASMLKEITFTAMGADENTVTTITATLNKEENMVYAEWLAAKGFDVAGLNDAQGTSLKAMFDAEAKAAEKKDDKADEKTADVKAAAKTTPADFVTGLRAESARIAKIQAACGGKHDAIQAKAIEEAWDIGKVEMQVELATLRASRTSGPAIHVTDPSVTPAVIEAALCQANGLQDIEKRFDEKTLQAAHTRYHGRLKLQQMLLEAAWSNGYTGRSFHPEKELLQAAFSTISLPGILSNTANKFLLEGFGFVEDTWKLISTNRSVSDFKTITSYRLTGDLQFEEVGPGGELKHGSLGEASYTNRLKTYGKMFAITRQDLINDDLGAFTSLPRRIGRGSALKLNDVFWTSFLDNASFFSSGNSNYFEGASTNLQSSSLQTAVEKFRKMVDDDGKPLSSTPKYLVVPPELEVTADELYQSTNINTGGSSTVTKVPNKNVFAGKYLPIVSAYLSNSSYSGYSTTAWYLMGDPNDIGAIEVAFLNGNQTPIVETAEADFQTLGIQIRGYFDFGISKQDYRGGVKSKGAA